MKNQIDPINEYCNHCMSETLQDLEIISINVQLDTETWKVRCQVCDKTNELCMREQPDEIITGNRGLLSFHIPPPRSSTRQLCH